jgi:serine/threonine protein kinase/WD40 repeat protein
MNEASCNQSSSAVESRDALLVPYFEALQAGEGRAAVRARLAAAHPDSELLGEFDELAAMLGQLDGIVPSPQLSTSPGLPENLPPLPDFRIQRQTGRGGMGVVYEAEQISLKRRVALKINAGNLSGLRQVRFLREQRVLAQLHHTHIVPIHTAGQVERWQYFAMAYIEGAALHNIIRAGLRHAASQPEKPMPPLGELATATLEERPDDSTRPDISARLDTPRSDEELRSREQTVQSSPNRPLTLSLAYFRSVARVLADTADALEHAHRAGICHRDVKPSNIMVDAQGQCWIIDFGLAGARASKVGAARLDPLILPSLTVTGSVMGTYQYMAPEQYDGWADPRSDVWGLGCTLYELLTLRPAFDSQTRTDCERQVRQGDLVPALELVRKVPADLVAVCRKALQKKPEDRSQTAGEFAADLRRWLNDEPTLARGAWLPRKSWLWTKRNPWGAAAVLFCAVAVVLSTLSVFLMLNKAAAEADLRAEVAERQAQEREYEVRLLHLQRARFGLPIGWSQDRLNLVRDHYKDRPKEAKRKGRDEAALALAGLDAVTDKNLEGHPAGSLAFSRDGKRLVLGGVSRFTGARPTRGGVYDRETDRMMPSEQPGEPGERPSVAFSADGVPLQLIAKDAYTLRLWDVDQQRAIREFTFAEKLPATKLDGENQPALALSVDGSLVAASTRLPDGKGVLVVWEAATGKEVARTADKVEVLAFAPDNSLLATGDDAGTLMLRPVRQLEKGTTLSGGRLKAHCLAFTRDPVRRHKDGRAASGWLLAAGEAGGGITIWDVERNVPRTQCLGSHHDVYSVAFSSDGTLLASCGRQAPRLWDVATGRLLLSLRLQNTYSDIAFSPDGQFLAASALRVFGHSGGVEMYHLDYGRGLQVMRGLRGQIAHVYLSPDDRYLAALSHDWQVGVWDLKAGQLLHVFEAPVGPWADNAALAFSAEGRLACASWREAVLWDVATGREVRRWKDLPPGLVNKLAFHATGKLLLFREETEDMKHSPDSSAHPKDHPRVCRIRDLFAKDPNEPLAVLRDLNWHVFGMVSPSDGSYFVVTGIHVSGDKRESQVIVYDGITGKRLWKPEYDGSSGQEVGLTLDSTGKLLGLRLTSEPRMALVEMPAGTARGFLADLGVLGPGAEWWVTTPPGDSSGRGFGLKLHRRAEDHALVTLGGDILAGSVFPVFNPKGTHITWGNADGTVTVCDIQGVRQRLAAMELGW